MSWPPAELRAALLQAAGVGPDAPVSVHETHASWVLVAGERAYKVKKPVALVFLDYSTLARRRAACREEVDVNQALAPEIYLGVRALVRDDGGLHLAVEHAPGAVEYVVEMRAFDERDTLAALIDAGRLVREDVEQTARAIAEFHRDAEVDRAWGPERVRERWRRNLAELAEVPPPRAWRLDVMGGFAEAFVRRRAGELSARAAAGLARDGHGDLRCEHVLVHPLRIVDRIEFDPRLRRADVACDVAFLAMDLEALDRGWAVQALYDAYARSGLDVGGQALRDFYAAHWAVVRAKVALIAAGERVGERREEQLRVAAAMWRLAERLCWRARRPLAIVVCGPAANGKSVLAAALAARARAPVVSSDEVRKRLAGVDPSQRAGAEHYRAAFTRATYERLAADAAGELEHEGRVIVDATCRARREREPLLATLRAAGARTLLVRCQVPLALALERAARRLEQPGHLSDATPAIVERHYREFEEPCAEEADALLVLDTSAPAEQQLAAIAAAADSALGDDDV